MLQLTVQHRLLLAVEPADFWKGINSLAALCKSKLAEDSIPTAAF
jgi:transposase